MAIVHCYVSSPEGIDFIVDICWPKLVSMSQGRIGFSQQETGDLWAAHTLAPRKVTWHCCNISCMIPRSCPSVAFYFPIFSRLVPVWVHFRRQASQALKRPEMAILSGSMPRCGMSFSTPRYTAIHGKNGEKWRCWSYQRHCHVINGEYIYIYMW